MQSPSMEGAARLEERIADLESELAARNEELEALRRDKGRIELALEGAELALWDQDFRANHIMRSPRWMEMLGFDPSEIGGGAEAWLDLVHPEDLASVLETARAHEADECPLFKVEHRMRTEDGQWKWILNWGRIVERDPDGAPLRAVGIHLDVNDRRRAEEALRKSKERFRELADLLPQTIFELDTEGLVTYLNRHGYQSTGYGEQDVARGLSFTSLFAVGQRKRVERAIRDGMRAEGTSSHEFLAQRKDGPAYPVLLCDRAIHHDGEVAGLRGFLVDITDRKRAERELAKADKLDSIGALAGGIAHDFNNILSAIIGNLSLVRSDLGAGIGNDELLREAESAAFRARDLTQQLLTFAKGGAPILKRASILSIVEEAAQLALRGSNVKWEIRQNGDLDGVRVDEGQIHQVFSNLLINADQAMPEGGCIRIECGNVDLGHRDQPPLEPGRYVRVRVRDGGAGISDRDLKRIFDPFFTTKEGGSGLGLATAYSIVRNHNGFIGADSKAGIGTTFTVHLPAANGREADVSDPEIETPSKGKGRILVLDDEQAVRRLAGRALRALGYTTELVEDGDAALEAYRAAQVSGDPFDAVILDLTIPGGLGGLETLRRLLGIDRQTCALVSSGYSNDPVLANYESYGFAGRLTKPYRVQDLSEALREVLSR